MTQREYDAQMKQINREQQDMHNEYDKKQQELADKVEAIDLQILELRKQIVAINREKQRVAAERFRMDMDFKLRKSEFAVDHPKDSMEQEQDVPHGHTIQDEVE